MASFFFAQIASAVMRERTAVKCEDPGEGTIREEDNSVINRMHEARIERLNLIESYRP